MSALACNACAIARYDSLLQRVARRFASTHANVEATLAPDGPLHSFAGRSKPQKRLPFADRIVVDANGGPGGDGCVAFNREKFQPLGGPSGGHGAVGGCVYVQTDRKLFDLSSVARHARAGAGGHGKGSWLHGKRGNDVLIKVPLGTVVRQIRTPDQNLVNEKETPDERKKRLFLHYPTAGDYYDDMPEFRRADAALRKQERYRQRNATEKPLIEADLSSDMSEPLLLCEGGSGGVGNSAFGPEGKFATRGSLGEHLKFMFELKILAQVALVGMPNSGKSTFLKAVSGSKTQAAAYAFTTLAPHIGQVMMYSDNSFQSAAQSNPKGSKVETFRFSMADLPGLIADASQNVGLGHNFLRHIERSQLLAYVVDLSLEDPTEQLDVLSNELELYQPGLSKRGGVIIANKADLVNQKDGEARLQSLRDWLGRNSGGEVVAVSALHSGNVGSVLQSMRRLLLEDVAKHETAQANSA